jgi:hypothetical protein
LRLKEIWQVDKTEDLANRIHKNVRCPAAGWEGVGLLRQSVREEHAVVPGVWKYGPLWKNHRRSNWNLNVASKTAEGLHMVHLALKVSCHFLQPLNHHSINVVSLKYVTIVILEAPLYPGWLWEDWGTETWTEITHIHVVVHFRTFYLNAAHTAGPILPGNGD